MTTLASTKWIGRASAMLRLNAAQGDAAAVAAPEAPAPARSLRERLGATLGRGHEGLSPRMLRRTLADLQGVVDPSVSEVEGSRRAHALAQWYAQATPAQRRDCWLLMSERFVPDAATVREARQAYERAAGTSDEAHAEIALRRAMASPRARLLQRFAAAPEGMRFLVELRAALLPELKKQPRLAPLDAELEQLFSTWFDVGFLELQRISWDSPASLIEKLIRYEAVHDIRSWSDVKNRLDSDRRCYGFFHPRLPGEPLIFVEVALTSGLSEAIAPLLDEAAALHDPQRATTAIFYSISNTQSGLRGVSFGDSLIKRVVETLQAEFPKLRGFATLSPIPGLRDWVKKHASALLGQLDAKRNAELTRVLGEPPDVQRVLHALEQAHALEARSPLRALLLAWVAQYLGRELRDGKPVDAVARFHLGNGARIEQLNWAGDVSPKGLRQSFGLMVNYQYDLRRLDRHRALLAQGKIPVSKAVEELYF
ncbi:MAG TPA: malonyl-CoA decarboxylase [Ramlibacter sp.]|nr:malonyl-CoA decarboxylase [Ramlibacter sp.]